MKFCFFKQKTAYEMRISDWSSDVCSSDLLIGADEHKARLAKATALLRAHDMDALLIEPGASLIYFTGVHWWRSERLTAAVLTREGEVAIEIGRASCRERVCQFV